MAKKKRNSKKKQQKRATFIIAVMLIIIFLIIGFFAIEAIKKAPEDVSDTTTQATQSQSEYHYENNDSYELEYDETEAVSTTEPISTEEDTHSFEKDETLPVNVDNENIADKIIVHYANYMGFPEGALFINEGEISKNGDIYTYTLRTNSANTPNKLIGDVEVNIGTGEVNDTMGTEEWNINE